MFILSAVAAAAALIGMALPASAATGDTAVTLNLTGGAVNITAPATVTLTGTIGTTPITGQLGTVTVTDTQGTVTPTWATSVSTTNFNAPTGSGISPIPVTDIHYDPGTVTRVNNTGTEGPVDFTAESTPVQTVAANAGGPGINSASWNPTLTVTIPTTAVATTYTATITHSTVP